MFVMLKKNKNLLTILQMDKNDRLYGCLISTRFVRGKRIFYSKITYVAVLTESTTKYYVRITIAYNS